MPACAQTCPTQSIRFGRLDDLRETAHERLAALHDRGVTSARLYGADPDEQPGTEGLHAFSLLLGSPEEYRLPPNPVAPARTVNDGWKAMGRAMAVAAAGALIAGLAGRNAR